MLIFGISCIKYDTPFIYVTQIELNKSKLSAFGLPITSEESYIFPCFKNSKNFIDTLSNNGILNIAKTDNTYKFIYTNSNDTIIGFLQDFPYDFIEYNSGYDYESYMQSELKVYKTKKLFRIGNWKFIENGKEYDESYDIKIKKQDIDFICN